MKPFPRCGAWAVNVQGRVGIIAGFAHDSGHVRAEFHLVASDGRTQRVELTPLDELRQAAWKDIPESRRPPKKAAAKMGYV